MYLNKIHNLRQAKKGMLEKMEVEAVENRLKTASSLIEFLKKGVERLFCMFCITGRYNLRIHQKTFIFNRKGSTIY